MVNGFVQRLQTRLAELKAQVAEYEVALKVGQQEAQHGAGRPGSDAFAAQVQRAVRRPNGAAKRSAKGKKSHVPAGALRRFVEAQANVDASPAVEARRLLPLAQAAGMTTTFGSMVQAIYVFRRAQRAGQTDLETPIYDYVKKHGPMPYRSVLDWFNESYATIAEEQPRRAIGILTALKGRQRMTLTPDGWWQAL